MDLGGLNMRNSQNMFQKYSASFESTLDVTVSSQSRNHKGHILQKEKEIERKYRAARSREERANALAQPSDSQPRDRGPGVQLGSGEHKSTASGKKRATVPIKGSMANEEAGAEGQVCAV